VALEALLSPVSSVTLEELRSIGRTAGDEDPEVKR